MDPPLGGTVKPDDVALGLDVIGRLSSRRTPDENAAWANGWQLVDYLAGLGEMVSRYNVDG
jgi:hypothetical protein